MIAFAFVKADGLPLTGGMQASLPEGAIALPAPFSTADLPRLRWTGEAWVWRDLALSFPTEAEIAAARTDELARARAEAVTRVNARVEAFRSQFATPGQAEIYAIKLEQARALVLNWFEPVDLSPWPAIVAEVGITAPTAWQVAQIILHQAARAKAALIASEAPRQAALAAIAGADDPDKLSPILADLIQALTGLSIQEP